MGKQRRHSAASKDACTDAPVRWVAGRRSKADGSRLIIEPSVKRRYRLGDLVAGITEENRHDETDWGKPVGLEFPD